MTWFAFQATRMQGSLRLGENNINPIDFTGNNADPAGTRTSIGATPGSGLNDQTSHLS